MNHYFEPENPFERRRSNRAILLVMAMALAGIALNDGVHALMTPAGDPSPRVIQLVPRVDQKNHATAAIMCRSC